MKTGPKPTLENALKRLAAKTVAEPNSGCWLWTGHLINSGYGIICFNSHNILVHRLAWFGAYGPIPHGKWVLHKCDVKQCVNPKHLFLGDNSENQKDAIAKGIKIGLFYHHEKMRALTHCPRGHEYSDKNTYRFGRNRKCRICHAQSEREKRAARREYGLAIRA